MLKRNTLKILQYNVKKSRETVMILLLQDEKVKEYNILVIQKS